MTAWSAVRAASEGGADVRWAVGWLVLVVVMAASRRLPEKAHPLALWLGAASVIALGMLVRSSAVVPAAVAAWMLAVAAGCGGAVMRACGVLRTDDLPRFLVLSVPLGLVVIAQVILVTGSLGWLSGASMLVVMLVLSAVAVATLRGRIGGWGSAERPVRASSGDFWCLGVGSVVFLLDLCWAVAPEVQFDSLNYHLAVPKAYLQHGAIVNLPYFFHSYFAHLVEALFVGCLALSGPIAAKLLVLGGGVVSALAVFVLGVTVFDRQVGQWGALLFYTTPTVGFLSGTAHTDLAAALFLTATLLGCLQWRAEPRPGWLYVTAMLAGGALAVKVNSAFGLAVPGLAVLASVKARSAWLPLCVGALLFGAVAVPWFAMIQAWTGNPVFPLYNGVFRSPYWDENNILMNAAEFGIGHSVPALLRLPFSLTFDTVRFGEGQPRGGAGVALLLALPWLVTGLRRAAVPVRMLLAASAVYLVLWALIFQYVRYYVPILPVICVLGAAAARGLGPALLAPAFFQVMVMPACFWQMSERFPITVAFGQESKESFLARTVGGYTLVARLNQEVPPRGRILSVGTEGLRFYLDAPLDSLSESLLGSPLRTIDAMPDAEMARRLSTMGYTHLLVDRVSLGHPEEYYPYLGATFLRDFTVQEACDDSTCAFRLKSP